MNSRSADWPELSGEIDSAKEITLESAFQIRPLLIYRVQKELPYIYILFPGRTLRLSIRTESMLNHILNVPRFRIADLPSDDMDSDRITLVGTMLERGFLEPADEKRS